MPRGPRQQEGFSRLSRAPGNGEGVSRWFPGCATPSHFCQPRDLECASPCTLRLCPRLFSVLLSPGLPLLEEIPCWDPSPAFPREPSTVGKGEVPETLVLEGEREQTEQALGSVCGPRHSEWGVCACV